MKRIRLQELDANDLAGLIQAILAQLVTRPEKLEVRANQFGNMNVISIVCDPHDARRVIGNKGAHFRAVETLVKAVDSKYARPLSLKPLEVERVEEQERRFSFVPRLEWPKENIVGLLYQVAQWAFDDEGAISKVCLDTGNTSSTIEMHVSEKESAVRVRDMDEVLSVLGKSLGLANGRVLACRVIANNLPSLESAQPETSDGRFAKEVADLSGGR